MWTDASDCGYGATYRTAWLVEDLSDESSWTTRPIVWRELYAIVIAVATWAHKLRENKIIYNCDNMAVVHILNNAVSKDPALMNLVRELNFISATFSFEWKSIYLDTASNGIADTLSRGDVVRFHKLAPIMDTSPKKGATVDVHP